MYHERVASISSTFNFPLKLNRYIISHLVIRKHVFFLNVAPFTLITLTFENRLSYQPYKTFDNTKNNTTNIH